MAVIRAAGLHCSYVVLPHQGDGLQLRRALRPEAALEQLDIAKAQRYGLLHAGLERFQVFAGQQTVPLLGELRDLGSDIAAIERRVRILRVGKIVVGGRERLVPQQGSFLRDLAAAQIKPRALRPAREELLAQIGQAVLVLVMEACGEREAFRGELARVRRDVAKAHAAPALEHRHERRERRGNARRKDVFLRNILVSPGIKSLRGRGARRGHVAVDRDDARFAGKPQQDRALAADGMHLRIHQPLDQRRRDCGVDRVAAGFQNIDAGVDRKVGVRRHRAVLADEPRVEGGRIGRGNPVGALAHGARISDPFFGF